MKVNYRNVSRHTKMFQRIEGQEAVCPWDSTILDFFQYILMEIKLELHFLGS